MSAVDNSVAKSLVLGLGNPGPEYVATRHNRGRDVVEELARRRGAELSSMECNARLAVCDEVVLGAPDTFMNRSGYAARCLMERRELEPQRILVVYDDVSLPLGWLRLRSRGGPGGQKGMASILECLGTDQVPRLRLGIAPVDGLEVDIDLVDFVLSGFSSQEEDAAREQIERAADACELWLAEGVEAAMNRFNGHAPGLSDEAGVSVEEEK